ncbi:MAG: hypothetical protein K2G23_09075, partial [Muribaculaceae bacterium]|nr:hypothetical protein [Muribaculaceae bacterium]
MIKKFLLPLILLFIGTNYMFADAKSVDGIEKELNRKLASAHSLKDSISLLYNLFDVVPNKEKSPYARKL